MSNQYWGIDLGGTKIEAVVIERESKDLEVICRKRIATEADQGYEHVQNRIALLVDQVADEVGYRPKKLGIGTPGTLEPSTGALKNSNTVCLNGQPFHKDLVTRLGLEVVMANDANCLALAETLLGVVPEAVDKPEVVFGVILGTGVGGGIVVNERVINGRQGIAGEWGHNFLHESGGDCYCGRKGCVETVLSGTGLQRYYKEISGQALDLKTIYSRYLNHEKDEFANRTIERLITYFGKAMAPIINVLDPDAIVLGGGVGNIDLLYTKGVEEVKKYVFNNKPDTLFLKPKLGDSAGVFGAAMLVV